jgi:acyl-CoA dehydrogenase
MDRLKAKAKKLGLWNLWLSGGDFQGMAGGEGGGLSNLEVRLHMNDLEQGADRS